MVAPSAVPNLYVPSPATYHVIGDDLMTFQVGLRATDGLVLASDRLLGSSEPQPRRELFSSERGFGVSKVSICGKHQIAVAYAGSLDEDEDPAAELCQYLDTQDTIPPNIAEIVRPEIAKYCRSRWPGYYPKLGRGTFLVVNPHGPCAFRRFFLNETAHELFPDDQYGVNGHNNTPVNFFPAYFRCNRDIYDLETATTIAAVMVLMESEINPWGVTGLEVWQFMQGKWHRLSTEAVGRLQGRFQGVKQALEGLRKGLPRVT